MYELAHIALAVKDCEKSAQFYSTVLDFSIRERATTEVFKVIFIKSGSLVIEILEYINPEPDRRRGVYDHLAFQVPDLPQAMAAMQAQGVKFENAQPRQAFDGRQIIFLSGPDGERIELVGPAAI